MEHDPIYRLAIQRLAENREEQRELEAFLATYRKLATPSAPDETIQMLADRDEWKAFAKSSTDEIVLAAMDLIAANKAPMMLGAIYEALTAKGVKIGGRIPRNNLGAKLSADPRLRTIRGHGWWFKDEDVPVGILESETEATNSEGLTGSVRPSVVNGAAVAAA